MIRRWKTTLLILCLAFTSGSLATGTQGTELPFRVGDPFPTLELPSLEEGEPVSLEAFRGKKVILHVFASW